MKSDATTSPTAVRVLIALQALLGIGAVISGAMLFLAPDGHLLQMPLSNLGPFSSFLIPGLLLFTFLGIYPLAVAYGLWKRPKWRWPEAINPFKGIHWSWAASLAAGVIVLIWIIVEVILLQAVAFLHVLCFVWAIALVALTLAPKVRQHHTR